MSNHRKQSNIGRLRVPSSYDPLSRADAANMRIEDIHRRLEEREAFLRRVIDTTPSMIFVKDWDGRFVLVNEALARTYGTTPEEIIGKTDADFNPDTEELEHFKRDDREVISTRMMKNIPEEPVRHAGGDVRWYSTVKVPLINPDGTCDKVLGVATDITVRRQAEEQILKLNRTLAVLSAINQLLIRASDEKTLLEEACRIAIDKGGYRMAWIGFAENDEERTVRPVASCGDNEDFLSTLRIAWSDTESGRGPTGSSIRTGKPVFIGDIRTGIGSAIWRREALKRGYASAIAVPLVWDGKALGAFSMYSGEPDYFVPEEIDLLTELASDLSYGIMSLRARAELEIAEEHKRDFYRRTILAATEGKLTVTEREEIERIAGPAIAVWELRKPEDLTLARDEASRFARDAGLDGMRLCDFTLCVGEATTNAFKHANGGTASIHRREDVLIVVVSDHGSGIEALVLPDLALKRGYSTAASLGMGFKAMISTADKLYLATGPDGTTIGIEMRLHPSERPSLLDNLPDTWKGEALSRGRGVCKIRQSPRSRSKRT